MQIDADGRHLTVRAPAKINLYLQVLGKREDGFHEIETVMCPIDLFDELVIEAWDRPDIELSIDCPAADPADPAWQIPATQQNLVVRAAEAVRRATDAKSGCRIQLTKNIPAAAGLGGGSSDAAATLVACLHLWASWDRKLALELAAQLGSDIPFFLGSQERIGLARAVGRGEKCNLLDAAPPLQVCITHPPSGCSTQQIYATLQGLDRGGPKENHAEEIMHACKTGQFQKIGAQLFNALQLPAYRLNEWVERQLTLLANCGFQYSLMTGSGSACFALVDTDDPGALERREQVVGRAKSLGIQRVYFTEAWYGPSIEQQLGAQPR